MTIGELSARTGVAASAIRYYESLGLIAKPRRESSRRVYGADAVDALSIVLLARSCGFRLDEIAELMRGLGKAGSPPSATWKAMAAVKRAEIEESMRQLRAMRRLLDRVESCRCESMAECGRRARG